jgi:hypothetical protein
MPLFAGAFGDNDNRKLLAELLAIVDFWQIES